MAKPGPKKWIPTAENIKRAEYLSGIGAIMDEIAQDFGVCENTLRANSIIMTAIKNGHKKFKVFVKGKLAEAIANGNMTAIIFYLKTQCGWKDKVEVSGDSEHPIEFKGEKFDADYAAEVLTILESCGVIKRQSSKGDNTEAK